MVYRDPRNQHQEGQQPGDQVYEDAREALTENEAEIRDDAGPQEDAERELSEEDRRALMEQNAEERFADIGDERDEQREDGDSDAGQR